MMLWYLTLGRFLKKFLQLNVSELYSKLDSCCIFFLFKWFALLISAHRFQDYAEDENKLALVEFIFPKFIHCYIL